MPFSLNVHLDHLLDWSTQLAVHLYTCSLIPAPSEASCTHLYLLPTASHSHITRIARTTLASHLINTYTHHRRRYQTSWPAGTSQYHVLSEFAHPYSTVQERLLLAITRTSLHLLSPVTCNSHVTSTTQTLSLIAAVIYGVIFLNDQVRKMTHATREKYVSLHFHPYLLQL